MRRLLITSVTVSLALAAGCGHNKKDDNHTAGKAAELQPAVNLANGALSIGEPMKLSAASAISVAEVLNTPEKFSASPVVIKGTVAEICESKGCWVTLKDPAAPGKELFIKFTCTPDGDRIVPMAAAGKKAWVEGKVMIKTITQDEARHYAEDAGKPKAEIEKIVGPQRQITVSAPSVKIAMTE
jgi:hypothetical protein